MLLERFLRDHHHNNYWLRNHRTIITTISRIIFISYHSEKIIHWLTWLTVCFWNLWLISTIGLKMLHSHTRSTPACENDVRMSKLGKFVILVIDVMNLLLLRLLLDQGLFAGVTGSISSSVNLSAIFPSGIL